MFRKGQGFRTLPALAHNAFGDEWESWQKSLPANGKIKVGRMAGCAQDFIYPERLKAALKIMAAKGCVVEFPMGQSCCGLPVKAMGERKAAGSVAQQNIKAFDPAGYDYIVTICAS